MSDSTIRSPRFARLPEEVLIDATLTHTDRFVYARMAFLCFNNNIVNVGQRKLAELCNLHRRSLRRCLEKLGSRGHISRAIGRWTRRTVFQLNSPVFLQDCERMGAILTPQLGAPERPRSRYQKRAPGSKLVN